MSGAKKRKKTGGRLPLISQQKIDAIVAAIQKGCPKVVAIKVARISPTAYKNWIVRGKEAWKKAGETEEKVRESEKLYVALLLQVEAALAEAIQTNLNRITTAGERDWKAAAWLTERLDPDNFAANRHEFQALKRTIIDLERQIADLKKSKPGELPAPHEPTPDPQPLPPVPPDKGNQQ